MYWAHGGLSGSLSFPSVNGSRDPNVNYLTKTLLLSQDQSWELPL